MAERVFNRANLCGISHRAEAEGSVERLEEVLVAPASELRANVLGLLRQPTLDDEGRFHRLLRQEQHRRSRHRRRGCEFEVVALKDEVDVRAELNALTGG